MVINIKSVLIYIIRAYQITPLHTHSMCRFIPTCSEYACEAIDKYGCLKGLNLSIKRILRCHPHGGFGYDELKKEGKDEI